MRSLVSACHIAATSRFVPILIGALLIAMTGVEAREVRVGVYENPPKLMAGESGRPDGIFGNLLTEIARHEGWSIQPVPCKWESCLEYLQSGKIDLLPDVARSEEREKLFAFHTKAVMHSWSDIYVPSTAQVYSILDFKGKRVAVLAGSIQENYLHKLFLGFGIDVDLVPATSFEDGFASVVQGRADAAAVNHNYGELNARRYGLKPSTVMFLPSELFFAANSSANVDLLAAIDRHMNDWQSDEESFYYKVI